MKSLKNLLVELIEAIEEYAPATDGHEIPECDCDFDEIECRGGDMGGCYRYETCKREIEFFGKLKIIKAKAKGE